MKTIQNEIVQKVNSHSWQRVFDFQDLQVFHSGAISARIAKINLYKRLPAHLEAFFRKQDIT